jgi:hypothetical protein
MTLSTAVSTAAYSVGIGAPWKGGWTADNKELTPSGGISTFFF